MMHVLVMKTERFSDALSFVIAAAEPDRIHAAPVALRLGMHLRIAIHLTGTRLQQSCSYPPARPSMFYLHRGLVFNFFTGVNC